MNEYGVFEGEKVIPAGDEEAVYHTVDLPFIPPELREGEEEIKAAEAGALPELVREEDIKGMVHVHSSWSDGSNTIEELARECIRLGYSYLCLSDHSQTAYYAGGLKVDELLAQVEEAGEVSDKLAPFKVFCGIESDILTDGALDYPDDILARLDFVIGSIHSKLQMKSDEATERLSGQ
jgi:DNA polymerase (family 10)